MGAIEPAIEHALHRYPVGHQTERVSITPIPEPLMEQECVARSARPPRSIGPLQQGETSSVSSIQGCCGHFTSFILAWQLFLLPEQCTSSTAGPCLQARVGGVISPVPYI